MPRRGPPESGTLRIAGAIILYQEPDGDWSLYPDPASELVRAELAGEYLAVQGWTGGPRILSTRPNELGMTIPQAIARGILRLRRDESSRSEPVTLVGLKAAVPWMRK